MYHSNRLTGCVRRGTRCDTRYHGIHLLRDPTVVRSRLEILFIATPLIVNGGQKGAQRLEVPYIRFPLAEGSLKGGYMLHAVS